MARRWERLIRNAPKESEDRVRRGRNYARATAQGNPAGDQAVGTLQMDENKSHNHSISWWASGGATLPNTYPGLYVENATSSMPLSTWANVTPSGRIGWRWCMAQRPVR